MLLEIEMTSPAASNHQMHSGPTRVEERNRSEQMVLALDMAISLPIRLLVRLHLIISSATLQSSLPSPSRRCLDAPQTHHLDVGLLAVGGSVGSRRSSQSALKLASCGATTWSTRQGSMLGLLIRRLRGKGPIERQGNDGTVMQRIG